MVIKVLGPGCEACDLLAEVVRRAVMMMGMEATLLKVRDPAEYRRYGLLFTPGLVINERLVCGGRIPSLEEVSTWLADAAMAEYEQKRASSSSQEPR